MRGPEFAIGSVEYKVVDWATRTPIGYLANTFGQQIVSGQLSNGFTVVRTDQGDAFAMGILTPPDRPKGPMTIEDDERYVFANETTEVHVSQVDFLGPFVITDADRKLFLRSRLQGPTLDVFVMSRKAADTWREQLQRGAPLGPPPSPAIETFAIQPGEQSRPIRLPEGSFVLVVDNSNAAGPTNVPVGSVKGWRTPWDISCLITPTRTPGATFTGTRLAGGVSLLSYSAELGEAD